MVDTDAFDTTVFVTAVKRLFMKVARSTAEVGAPYMADRTALPVAAFTGIIAITGAARGCVYFSAPRALLMDLLLTFGEVDRSDDSCADCAGEIANTIAGNARDRFGPAFAISFPIVVRGPLEEVHLPRHVRAVVVPIDWRRHRCHVVIALESAPSAGAGFRSPLA